MNADQKSPLNRPMHCIQLIDSLGTGGAQKMVVLLAHKCAEHGVPFAAISLEDDAESDNAREIRACGGRTAHFPGKGLLDMRRIGAIRAYLKREGFDLVQTYLTYGNIVGSLAGFLAGVPVLCSLRNLRPAPLHFNTGRHRLETLCFNLFARRVMANGYAIAEANNSRLIGKTIDVVPNAVAIPESIGASERRTLREEIAGGDGRLIVFSSGRLVPVKRFEDLIDAVDMVRQYFPRVFLAIAGAGIALPDLKQRVIDKGLEESVGLLGYRDDVPRLLQAGDVYASASVLEGMSVAILEAMAAGLPVVATDVGDAARVVPPEAGTIVPISRPDRIAEALMDLFRDLIKMREMGANACELVRRKYNTEDWFANLMALYQKTTKRGWSP